MSTRILLVDDHRIFLDGMTELLDRTNDLKVVATATDADQALRLTAEKQPDIVITDITLPDTDGVKLIEQLRSEFPGVKIVCLTMHADAQLIESAFKAGALAYVLKDCELSELIEATRRALNGETYMSGSAAEAVADSFRLKALTAAQSAEANLTERERQVLLMLAEGLTTKQIAGNLNLSVKTIGTHRESLMKKLDIHSVAGLTKYAIRRGMTTVN